MAREGRNAAPLDTSTVDTLFMLYRKRDFAALAERVRVLLATHPDELALLSLLGAALLELGDYEGAAASYAEALGLRPGFAKAHNGLGIAQLRLGRTEAARASFERAVHFGPELAEAHFNLGIVLEHAGRWCEAVERHARTVELAPRHYAAWTALGVARWQLGRLDGVLGCFETALAIRADHVAAQRGRLAFLEQSNRHDELRRAVSQAQEALGAHGLVGLYEAILAEIDGDRAGARARLESLELAAADEGGAHDARQRHARLARLSDALGDTEAALAHARAANKITRRLDAQRGVDRQTFLGFVAGRRRLFGREDAFTERRAPAGATDDAARAPIFVVGFPRSGTTLLDSMLRGHPRLALAEECNAVATMVNAYAGADDAALESLPTLDAEALAGLRATYREALARRIEPRDGVRAVDRFGLNMIYAGEIRRVFPEARFVLVLRHPADCVLSCYMQTFESSSANASFCSLEDAAELYDRVFDLWHCYERVLELVAAVVRYEDLVADVEGTCRGLLERLELEWHAGVLEHERTARARGYIATASYNQVTQPVGDEAVERWRRYSDALEPVLPVLEPWIERFGYTR